MCPGVTDTPLISEAHLRQLLGEWGEECGRELDELTKQKWVRCHSVVGKTAAVMFSSVVYVAMQSLAQGTG